MFTRFDTIHERDRHPDGRTDTARRHRPRLCITSRGKNTNAQKQVVTLRLITSVRTALLERKLRQGQNLIRDSNLDFRINLDTDSHVC